MKKTKPQLWVFYYEKDPDDGTKLRECIASGSCIPVDKRLSIESIEFRVTHGYYPIHKNAVAFAVHAGDSLLHECPRVSRIRYITDVRNTDC